MQFGKKNEKSTQYCVKYFFMLSVVIQTSIVYAEEGKTGSEYYLSDLNGYQLLMVIMIQQKRYKKIIHLHRGIMVRIRKSVLQWKMVQHAHLKKV